MQMLYEYFKGFGELSKPNMDFLMGRCQKFEISKGFKLIEPNQKVDSVFFLEQGFLHYYTYNDMGERITLKIVSPGYCWTVMESFVNQLPTTNECVALSKVTYCELKRSDYDAIKQENKELSNFIQTITEQVLSAKVVEANKRSSLSVEERYLDLLQNNPSLVQEVPVQIIASFIGTSRETLHRIRRKLTAA